MEIATRARLAANALKVSSNNDRNAALKAIHDRLRDHKDAIMEANKLDVQAAQSSDLSSALIKRLELTPTKFDVMLQGVLDVAALEDPVNKTTLERDLDEGLRLYRVSCPVGVLLVIFEARPEVIAQIGSLAIKSGNAAILKGGKESTNTFKLIQSLVNDALSRTKIPTDALQLITARETVGDLLKCDGFVDMVIPRGSKELVQSIKRSTTIPVLGHADGICSVYLDESADPEMAAKIVVDSKTNYPAACNACETLLINKNAEPAAKSTIAALLDCGVTVYADEPTLKFITDVIGADPLLKLAGEDAYDTEYLGLAISAKQVDSVEEAIQHINAHGSHHTDCIVTNNEAVANKFLLAIDSAGVYWNASTRFADGYRYGFGAEIGVSTNRLHARGPVGLEGIMSYQYVLKGHGQIAGDYVGGGGSKPFQFKDY